MLIARGELRDVGVRDLRITDGVISEIGPGLRPRGDEPVLDAEGHAVLPGLHDHHLHLRATAAASSSVDASRVDGIGGLRMALHAAAARRSPGGWIRVVGYHESIAGDLDRTALDRLSPPGVPVRVQHRSGALWVLNTTAWETLDLRSVDEPDVDGARGHLWRRDDLLRPATDLAPTDLAEVGRAAAARGITGFTDASPDQAPGTARDLARDLRAAGVVQHLHLMGPVGARRPDVERATLGPVKVLLDDDRLPSLPQLCATVRAAHAEARPVAVHCVTRVQLVLAVAALDDAGTIRGDRIEHGSVIPPDLIGQLARLGVTVVSQPHFVAERGDDYRRDVDPDDLDSLYRLRSLAVAGVGLAAGSDAPFGKLDPWPSIAAAVDRRTRTGHTLGPREALAPADAVDLYLGHPAAPAVPRRLAPGEPADLCVLGVRWRDLPDVLGAPPVRATIIAGHPVHLHP